MSFCIRRWIAIAAVVFSSATVAGCASISNAYRSALPEARQVRAPSRAVTSPQDVMRFQSGDKVRIVVQGEGKMSGTYAIDPAGLISIPLLGSFEAANRSRTQLKNAVVNRLRGKEILINPVVAVSLASFRPFYVLGEVEKPGRYSYSSGMNVMSAMAVAGGYTYRASQSTVKIQRAGESKFTEYKPSPAVLIYPGDLISVPERYF
ncbi:MAG: polysaccharide export protein [Hyphomicrobiales bacterium]|nr:polysaccharide export protein [Hyphomicrobiales bacterium]